MPVSNEIKQHLAGSTSTAVFLKITARDGTVLRVCSCTRNKIVDGETYFAYPLTPSTLQATNGLKADNLEVTAIYSELFTAATLRSRKWEGARIEYRVMNYRDLSMGHAERRVGFIGETTVGKFAAKPEFKSLSSKLGEPVGRTYQEDCDVVELGDNRCKVDLNGTTLDGYKIRINATVAEPVLNRQQFSVVFDGDIKPAAPGVVTAKDNLFERGKIRFTSGANAGVEMQILANTGNALTLYLPLFYSASIGDEIELIAGCNRKIATCRDEFGNAENNRSFFMLPGTSKVFRIPD